MESPARTAPELLLREAAHVHRLARAIVRDAQVAHDVAQDTLLVALQRPPRAADDPRTLRAWLTKVVRSLARRAWRDERTRMRHEQPAAGPEPQGREGRTAASLQQQRELLAAVADLAEPYRTAITMRFLEGSSPRAMAKALGVEPAAVRQRIHRGLSMLRARLERTHGDARLAVAAIVPWSSWLPLVVHGVSIMTMKKLAACGIAAAVAAAFLVPRGDEARAPEPHVAKAPPVGEAAVAGTPAESVASTRSIAAGGDAPAPATAAATTGTLVVEVHRSTGRQLPDAPVAIWNVGGRRGPDPEQHRGVTDAGGRARFDALPPGQWMVVVAGRTEPKDKSNVVAVRVGEVVVHEVHLRSQFAVSGVVVDPNGNIVPQARVVLEGPDATTLATAGPRGEFRIEALRPPSVVQARAAGFQPGRTTPVSGADGAEVRVELEVGGPARSIRGSVRDADGRPCADAKVALVPAAARAQHRWEQPSAIEWQRTDRDGSFRHDEGAAGAWIVVAQARDDAIPPAWAEVDTAHGDAVVELRAAAEGRLRGSVLRGAEPIAADVIAWPDGAALSAAVVQDLGWRQALRGDGGAFLLRGLCAGPVRVRVIEGGAAVHEAVVDVAAGEIREWNAALPPSAELEVVVRGAMTKDLAAMVNPAGERADELARVVGLSGGEGTWRGARAADSDVYLLSVDNKVDMVQLAVRSGVPPTERAVLFELTTAELPVRWLQGRLVDERLEAVANRALEVRRTDDPRLIVRRRAAAGADGRFRIGPLPPGQYDLVDAAAREPQVLVRRFVGADRDEDVGDVVIRGAR